MNGVRLRRVGAAGRITLARPEAMNALNAGMIRSIAGALGAWAADPRVAMIVIDSEGERAFCAGGDIADLHRQLAAGDPGPAREFWAAEYRLNLALSEFPKPAAAFLRGYTLGGGVGIGCHNSHRIVGEGSRIALPECGIGLIPDAGGSLLLARAPGRLGEFLGLTGAHMGPADAIHAGFADYFIPEARWPGLIAHLEESGDWTGIDRAADQPPPGRMEASHDLFGAVFGLVTVPAIAAALEVWQGETAEAAAAALAHNAPLAMAAALVAIRAARCEDDLCRALVREYRFASRSAVQGDLREGIRARIIDRDHRPHWAHPSPREVTEADVAAMFAPPESGDWQP